MNVLERGLTNCNYPKDFPDLRYLENEKQQLKDLQKSSESENYFNYSQVNQTMSKDFINENMDWDNLVNLDQVEIDDVMEFRKYVYGDWWTNGELDFDLLAKLKYLERKLPMSKRKEYVDIARHHQTEFVKYAYRRNHWITFNIKDWNQEAPIYLSNIRNAESDADKIARKAQSYVLEGQSIKEFVSMIISQYKEQVFKPFVKINTQ